MVQPEQVACLILAAGNSQRFGSAKMLHPFDAHRTILQATIDRYLTVYESVYVVVKSSVDEIAESLDGIGVQLIESPNSSLGMSQSIVAGVEATQPKVGWLIALGDMPYVRTSSIQSITRSLTESSIVVPVSQKQPGNPVAFGVQFREQLLALNGDVGAKPLVHSNSDSVHYVETGDNGIHHDIDTPQDLIR